MANKLVQENKTHKSLKLRIYPNREQTIFINKTFGCCRLVYNERLQERNEFYIENILPIPKENKSERNKKYKEYKPSDLKTQFPFLSEVSSQALCQSENDLKNAYNNFFKSAKGIRKEKSGFPKFKSKKNNRQSYRECIVSETALNFFSKYIKIPKLGKVVFSHDSLPKWYSKEAKLCNITVEKSCSNRYYAVLLFEIDKPNYKIENRKDAKNFVFYDGPAYANGFPGVHHMLAKILKDAVCKYKTMKGFKVDRKVGWDTHGLPTEVNVEKLLGKTFTIIWMGESKYETTIDNAIKLLSILEEYAKNCYNVTHTHIKNILEATDEDYILKYNYTEGYPKRPIFNI